MEQKTLSLSIGIMSEDQPDALHVVATTFGRYSCRCLRVRQDAPRGATRSRPNNGSQRLIDELVNYKSRTTVVWKIVSTSSRAVHALPQAQTPFVSYNMKGVRLIFTHSQESELTTLLFRRQRQKPTTYLPSTSLR